MRRFLPLLLSLLLLSTASSCAAYRKLSRAVEAEDEIKKARLEFYEDAADAYFAVGWEYFTLAQELERGGQAQKAQIYARQAKIYSDFAKQWKGTAERIRAASQSPRASDGFAPSPGALQ